MLFENSKLQKNITDNTKKKGSFFLESSNYSLWYFQYYEILEKIKVLEKEHNYNVFFNSIQRENYKTYLDTLELKLKNNFYLNLLLRKKFLSMNGVLNKKIESNNSVLKNCLETLNSNEIAVLLNTYNKTVFLNNKSSIHHRPVILYESLPVDIVPDTRLVPDINGLSREFFINKQDETIYRKYY